MSLKLIVKGFILFVMFLIGYGLYSQTPTTMPKDGQELFFYLCIILASALGRNVDKVIERLLQKFPNPTTPKSQRKSDR